MGQHHTTTRRSSSLAVVDSAVAEVPYIWLQTTSDDSMCSWLALTDTRLDGHVGIPAAVCGCFERLYAPAIGSEFGSCHGCGGSCTLVCQSRRHLYHTTEVLSLAMGNHSAVEATPVIPATVCSLPLIVEMLERCTYTSGSRCDMVSC